MEKKAISTGFHLQLTNDTIHCELLLKTYRAIRF